MVLALWTAAPQADCEWQLLGEREVDHRADHDAITVSGSDRTFSRVQLRVKGATVRFDKVTVYFRNGTQQELDFRDEIKACGMTRDIDLQGKAEDRNITRIDFNYKTDDSGPRAVVQLWGLS
jgi:hypothetical protein